MLAYEKLDVYRCAIEFLATVGEIVDSMPTGTAALRDQIERASLSIVANIAEGQGVRTAKERDRHLGIARGSAMECGALLDACRLRGVCSVQQLQGGKQLLFRIVSMLTRMLSATAEGRRDEASPDSSSQSSRSALPDRDTV
jgi:four helix bundle protein